MSVFFLTREGHDYPFVDLVGLSETLSDLGLCRPEPSENTLLSTYLAVGQENVTALIKQAHR